MHPGSLRMEDFGALEEDQIEQMIRGTFMVGSEGGASLDAEIRESLELNLTWT